MFTHYFVNLLYFAFRKKRLFRNWSAVTKYSGSNKVVLFHFYRNIFNEIYISIPKFTEIVIMTANTFMENAFEGEDCPLNNKYIKQNDRMGLIKTKCAQTLIIPFETSKNKAIFRSELAPARDGFFHAEGRCKGLWSWAGKRGKG